MRPRFRLRPLSLALACVAAAAMPATAQPPSAFSKTVFIGDSLSDAGYFRPLLPPTAQPVTGQFTTNPGLVWAQYLGNYYGTDASTAWLATGTTPRTDDGDNYAVGGARVATPVTGALGYTPSLVAQTAEYLRRANGRADPNALYTVWGGANDLFAITAGAPVEATIGQAVTAQIGIVGQLHTAGARYILVPNIPDLGITPGFRAQGAAAMAQGTALSAAYNNALYNGLAAQGLRIIPLNTFGMLQEIVASPAAFGISNVTGTACQPQITAQSLTCNPTSYVSADAAQTYGFADGVHPSSAAHEILADYAIATIEGPRQITLLAQTGVMSGRAQLDVVADQIEARGDAAGGRFWGGLRWDGQRFKQGMSGDGFDGGGPGLAIGYDRAAGHWVYGGYIAAAQQRIDFGRDRGDYKQREAGIGGYAGWHGTHGWLDAQLGWSQLGFDVRRELPLGVGMRRHDGSPDGRRFAVGLSTGWRFGEGDVRHGPMLRIYAQNVRIDGYAESAPELSTALAYPKQDIDSLQVSAGWQLEWQASADWQPFARISIERELEDRPEQAFARMSSLPATTDYAVPAPAFDDAYSRLGLGARGQLFGLDALVGANVDIGRKDGDQHSLYFTLGKRF